MVIAPFFSLHALFIFSRKMMYFSACSDFEKVLAQTIERGHWQATQIHSVIVVINCPNNQKYEIDLTLMHPRFFPTLAFPFLSLLHSLPPYSHRSIWVSNGSNLRFTCDNIYTNLFHKLDMVDLQTISGFLDPIRFLDKFQDSF